jgi:hypothetical protein
MDVPIRAGDLLAQPTRARVFARPGARPGGDPPTGYAALARWLVRALATAGALGALARGAGE